MLPGCIILYIVGCGGCGGIHECAIRWLTVFRVLVAYRATGVVATVSLNGFLIARAGSCWLSTVPSSSLPDRAARSVPGRD